MIRRSTIRHGIVALVLALAAVPLSSGSAGAANGLPISCTAAGTVLFQNGNTTHWQVLGKGSCQGDFEGTYFLDFTGAGTSDSLGNCDVMNDGSIVPVTNLDIHVVGSITNLATGIPKAINQHWVAPLTTYPVATPFLIQDGDGNLTGGGVFLNHIFIQCLNSPVAQFTFVFVR